MNNKNMSLRLHLTLLMDKFNNTFIILSWQTLCTCIEITVHSSTMYLGTATFKLTTLLLARIINQQTISILLITG